MFTTTTPYRRALDGGLVLKSLCDPQDAERLISFYGHIFGEEVAVFSRALIFRHPFSRPEHWLYVEDEGCGQVVSALALIPWRWRCEEVALKCGEMGIVATLESYRHRGLVRALVARHHELLREGDYDLSHIQGIPYFYRQFGYEYAIPLESNWHIELRDIPDNDVPFKVRAATLADIPALMRMYDEATAPLHISTLRDAAVWEYLLKHNNGTDSDSETWLIVDENGQAIGYWRIARHGFGEGLIVSETSRLHTATAEALLRWLKAAAVERHKPYIRFNLPAGSDLLRVARGWGAHDSHTYAWQIHIVEAARLLRKLTPVLERRIACSPLAGFSRTVIINLYREALELRFDKGKLLEVISIGLSDEGEIRIPPLLLAPLALGYLSREALAQMYPDVGIYGQAQLLVDVLFPKLESFIFTNY